MVNSKSMRSLPCMYVLRVLHSLVHSATTRNSKESMPHSYVSHSFALLASAHGSTVRHRLDPFTLFPPALGSLHCIAFQRFDAHAECCVMLASFSANVAWLQLLRASVSYLSSCISPCHWLNNKFLLLFVHACVCVCAVRCQTLACLCASPINAGHYA